MRLLLGNPNFLILDEPTNDFDIFTMNILEQFLSGFKGCLLIVSHDRCFMDKIADSLFILEDDGSVSGYVGKCSEYLDYRKQRQAELEAGAAEKAAAKKAAAVQAPAGAPAASEKPRRRTFKEQKEFESVEAEIARLEERKPELEAAMADSDYAKSAAAGAEYTKLLAALDAAYARWDELASLGD